MTDWKKVASDAEKAMKKVDQSISQLDKEIKANIKAAVANGKVTEKEKARNEALVKQVQRLVNTRTKIVEAALEALDSGSDVARMRQKFIGIRKSLSNREKELMQVEKVAADAVAQALRFVADIVTILV